MNIYNKKQKVLLLAFFFFICVFYFTFYKNHTQSNNFSVRNIIFKKDPIIDLKFSNTSTWDVHLLMFLENKPKFLPSDWESRIKLDPPPENNSEETQKELRDMVNLKSKRDLETLENITKEQNINTTKFGDYTIGDYMDKKLFPKTSILISSVFNNDLNIVIFTLKNKFDRVRPNILDSNIDPVIDVPQHPAYPSGHSTQTHLLAFILTKLSPKKDKEFKDRADQISLDREVAGLHYHSDSVAGDKVAQQIMSMLLQNLEFMKLLNDAKSEWK